MRIIIDTEMERIIVPDSFFKQVEEENKIVEERGGKKLEPEEYIKNAFEKATKNQPIRKADLKK